MKRLIIGVSNYMPEDFSLLSESLDEQFNRTLKPLEHVELTDVGAAIITSADIKAGLHKIISLKKRVMAFRFSWSQMKTQFQQKITYG